MKKSIFVTLFLVNLSSAIISNDIEKSVGFEFIKYKIEAEVKHWIQETGLEKEFEFKSIGIGNITNNDPTVFLVGIDSVRIDSGGDPLCGCDGCYSKNAVVFFGMKKKWVSIEYGACGGNFEEARFKKGKKSFIVHYSVEQAKKIGLVFKKLSEEGLKEIKDHYLNE